MTDETRLVPKHGVRDIAVKAATAVADAGGSPRAQIDAARKASGQRLCYAPHIGRRQRERELKRMAKQQAKSQADE